MRVVLDTNVLVSAVILPHSAVGPILSHLRNGAYTLLYSESTLNEIVDVLNRPRISRKYGVTAKEIQTIVALILLRGEAVTPAELIVACRDPKDDQFLTVAVNGRADVMVSGDQDLLVLHPFRSIPIVPPRVFLQQFLAPSDPQNT